MRLETAYVWQPLIEICSCLYYSIVLPPDHTGVCMSGNETEVSPSRWQPLVVRGDLPITQPFLGRRVLHHANQRKQN